MCFCKPTIRTPFCPDCNTAMFLRINELTEERDALLNTQCDFEQRTHCDGTSDYRCGSNHNMTLLKFFRSEVDSLKAERDALIKVIFGDDGQMGMKDCIDLYYYGAWDKELDQFKDKPCQPSC